MKRVWLKYLLLDILVTKIYLSRDISDRAMAAAEKRNEFTRLHWRVTRVADADRRLRLAAAERLGLGATDFDALVLLDTAGPLAAGRIAEAMAITTGAVTGLIDRLERAGYVQRTRHEADRRQVSIGLAARTARPARRVLEGSRSIRRRGGGELDDAALAAARGSSTRSPSRRSPASPTARPPTRHARDDSATAIARRSERSSAAVCGLAGGAHVELRGARIKDLYRATFQGKRPQIAVEPDGLVTLQYKSFSWFAADSAPRSPLTTTVPWAIEIRRGVSHLTADLRELEVTGIDITGGTSESELTLPRPRGLATLRITGGASRLVVKRPRGTAAQVVIRGGASNFVFDEQRLGAVGSAIRLATPAGTARQTAGPSS